MLERIYSLLVKEFIQLWRDKWGRVMLIVPPLVQLLVFGYAATFDLKDVPFAVYNEDRGAAARDLLAVKNVSQIYANAVASIIERVKAQLLGQFPAVHLRHDHVGHQQVNLTRVRGCHAESVPRGARGQHGVSQPFEHPLDEAMYALGPDVRSRRGESEATRRVAG